MADEPACSGKAENSTIGFAFPAVNLKKVKSPFIIVPLPDVFLPFLGQIAVLWGQFENSFEAFFQAMCSANKATEDWRHFSFEQKHKLFRKEMQSSFALYPSIILCLSEILDDAERLQIKRNVLLHGSMKLELGRIATLHVIGHKKKQIIEEQYTAETLEDLCCELAHLAGRMGLLKPPLSSRYPLGLASQDRLFLQDFLMNNHPDRPNPTIPGGQPGSSRA